MVFDQIFNAITENQYIRAGALFFAILVLLRVGLFVLEKILFKISSKTKTDIDDLLLEKSSKPLTFISLLIALVFSLKQITFSIGAESIVFRLLDSLLAISIGYLFFIFVDIALFRVWRKLAKKTKTSIDDSIGQLVHEVLRIVIIVTIVIFILNIWGVNIGPFLAGLGIAGLAVALALQPTLSNIFSGISLVIDQTFRVGDVVKLESGEMGEIYRISLRTTRIKSFDNEMIIVPNSQLANSRVMNFFQPDPSIRVNFDFGVEYGVDPEYIKKIVLEEIEQIEIRKKDEEIRVLFTDMGDSSLKFKIMFWVDDIAKKWPAHQEAISRIYRRLYKEKIGIPFPQRTVWMRDEGKAKSPTPFDKKFDKVQGKFYSSFGHEYQEEDKKNKEPENKKLSFAERFRQKINKNRKIDEE